MSGGSSKQTVGYKYSLGLHMALAHGPLDSISEIQVDRRVAWTGLVTDGTITINAEELFGGDKREGGVSGLVDIAMGGPTQIANTYLQSVLGDDIPAFRGVACAVLNQCYMGNNPYLKPWAFKAARIITSSGGVDQWNIPYSQIIRPGEETASEEDGLTSYFDTTWANLTAVGEPADPTGIFPAASGSYTLDIPTDVWDAQYTYAAIVDQPFIVCDDAPNFAFVMNWSFGEQGVYITPNPAGAEDTVENIAAVLYGPDTGGSATGIILDAGRSFEIVRPGGNLNTSIQCRIGIESRDNGGTEENRLYVFTTRFNGLAGDKYVYSDWVAIPADAWKVVTGSFSITNVGVVLSGSYKLESDIAISACLYYVNDESNIITAECELSGTTSRGVAAGGNYTSFNETTDDWRFLRNANITAAALWIGSQVIACDEVWDATQVACGPDGEAGCYDMNPAHIIRECLTDDVWGMGYAAADIDSASFESAAETLFSEAMGMSILWEREQPIEEFIGEVLKHIDAALYVSRSSGKFVLKLIRSDADSNTITLDETNVSGVSNAKRPTISELTNAVSVVYWNAETDEDASVTLHNEALRQIQGVGISTTIQFPGFSHESIATRVAERELQALSTPLLSCEVTASREAATLNIGDVFYLNWPDLEINNTLMRANQIDYGDGRDNSVTIACVQDVFSTPSDAIQAATSEVWIDPTTILPLPAVARAVQESPYYAVVLGTGETETNDILSDDPSAGFVLVAGGRQANELNANILTDAGAGFVDYGIVDFHPYAYIVEEISETATTLSIEQGKDLRIVSSGTIAQIGSELVRVDSVDQDSNGQYVSVTVGRGILDTTPKRHELVDSNGTYIKFWGDFAESDDIQYADGETVDVKIQSVKGNATLSQGDTPTDTVTFNSRAIRPYPPGNLQIDGLSYPDPYTWTADHTLTWAHRDRLQQTDGSLYDHTEGDIGPEDGITYRVEGYAFIGDSTVEEQFLQTDVGTQTEWGMDSNLSEVDSNMGFPPDDARTVTLKVWAVRDGYDSWQAAEVTLQVPPFTDSVGDSNA